MSKRGPKRKVIDPNKDRMELLELKYKQLLEKNPHFVEKLKRRPDWEKFITMSDGKTYIRCQAAEHGTVNAKQCTGIAINGKMICRRHGGHAYKQAIELRSKLKQYGLYEGGSISVLKKEMEELQEMPRESMFHLNDEVKLLVGVVRKYLANTTDEQIAKRPYTLVYLLQNVLAMKEANHNITHSPKVVFTREQVEYLFMKVRLAIMSVLKDQTQMEQMQIELQKIAIELKAEGWKM